jgi:hypothetical protein
MSMSTTDDFRAIVERLRSWGFSIVEWSGCYGRSNGLGWSAGRPVGHINHHFVCSLNPDQGYINGLVGNLASGSTVNWFADVNGQGYLVGTGPMNHAGTGNQSVLDRTRNGQAPTGPAGAAGSISGNAHYSGTELQHPGDSTPYPAPMIDLMVAINAAEFLQWGYTAARAINHYEWTNRKIDMSWLGGPSSGTAAGDQLRADVQTDMTGGATPPGPVDWWDELSDDEKAQLLADVAEIKMRLRGADTGPGERHESFDMLQGIDADTLDTYQRVRGQDPNVDTLQRLSMDHADIRQDISVIGAPD